VFCWNVKEGKLQRQKCTVSITVCWDGQYVKEVERSVYACENIATREEKIFFVDRFLGGELAYVLVLQEAYEADRENGIFIGESAVSIKEWIRRHDIACMVNWLEDAGYFEIGGCIRSLQNPDEKSSDYDLYHDLVDELFNRQLQRCEKLEREYLQSV